jgi:hypothetical protein
MPDGDAHELRELLPERSSELSNAGNASEMRQIDALRAQRREALDRAQQLLGIELRRRRRGDDEGTLGAVEGPVRQAEGIASEDRPSRRIEQHLMVECVSGSVQHAQFPAPELQPIEILALHDALYRNR